MRTLTSHEIQAVSGGATWAESFQSTRNFFNGVLTIMYLLLSGRGIGDLY